MQLLKVHPAYGRRYTSPEAIQQDFLIGKDFSVCMAGGPYMSIRDFFNDNLEGFDGVQIVQVWPMLISLVLLRDAMKDGYLCECGATIGPFDSVCTSCRKQYEMGQL